MHPPACANWASGGSQNEKKSANTPHGGSGLGAVSVHYSAKHDYDAPPIVHPGGRTLRSICCRVEGPVLSGMGDMLHPYYPPVPIVICYSLRR